MDNENIQCSIYNIAYIQDISTNTIQDTNPLKIVRFYAHYFS